MSKKRINNYTFRTHARMQDEIDDIRALAIYHHIKALFKNSTVYNFSYNKISKITGYSHGVSKRMVHKLIDHGFANIHDGNLTMISSQKIHNKYKFYKSGWRTYKIDRNNAKEQIINILYLTSLAHIKRRQEHKRDLKRDIKLLEKPEFRTSIKRMKALLKEKRMNGRKCYEDVVFTSRNLAKYWRVSHTKAAQILKSLSSIGYINKSFLIENMSDYIGEVYYNIGYGHCFTTDKGMFIHRGTVITSLKEPIYSAPVLDIHTNDNGDQEDCKEIKDM